jgi:pyruvate dehydrogenase E2 component (dihydrolipoamide acetyltransferase)
MPTEIYLVKVGMNMTEGVVEEWYVADGGTVEKGELIYRLETEKVNLDVDAEASGTVKHVVGEGIPMKPGEVVGYIYAPGEAMAGPSSDGLRRPAEAPQTAGVAAPAHTTESGAAATDSAVSGRILSSPAARRLARELGVDIAAATGSGPGGRIVEADVQAVAKDAERLSGPAPSSPIARRVARELGVDITHLEGSGPGGRITRQDVEAAARPAPTPHAPPAAAAAAASAENRRVAVKGMRKTIAARMRESLQTAAQLTMDMDVVMDDAVRLRGQLIEEWQEDGIRPSYTDLVIRAVAKALERHPQLNATFTDTEITLMGEINVGVAVALEDGLIVPVVRAANRLALGALSRETARLAAAARDGTLGVDDLKGGTFTVSPLGMFGVDSFTPIINLPQVGILGVNRIRDDVAWDGDRPVRQQRMMLSLTWDHRALDGAPAAQFLATVRDLLESPFRLLV